MGIQLGKRYVIRLSFLSPAQYLIWAVVDATRGGQLDFKTTRNIEEATSFQAGDEFDRLMLRLHAHGLPHCIPEKVA